jgi:hypothetical protein
MPPQQALHLAVFAELNARMSAGEKKSEVLAEAKVDAEHWEASQQFWLGRMADDANQQRYALTMKYASLCQAALSRLAATKPAKSVFKRPAPIDRNRVVVYAAPAVPSRSPSAAVPAGPVSSSSPPMSSPATPQDAPASVPPVAPRSHVARLTVEQLAAMRAELATSPEPEHPEVRRRFGLDDATWQLEEDHWQRRLAIDPELFGRYLKRFQYCRSLLQRP